MIASDSYRDYDGPSFFSQLFVQFDEICMRCGALQICPFSLSQCDTRHITYDRTLRSQVPLSTSLCVCISIKRRTARKRKTARTREHTIGGKKITLVKHTCIVHHANETQRIAKFERRGRYNIHPSCIVRYNAHITRGNILQNIGSTKASVIITKATKRGGRGVAIKSQRLK